MSLVLSAALLCLFSSWLSLPPLASARTTVTHLPGFDGPLPFYLETGYEEVDEVNGAHLFYYFIKSENNPAKDPLIVWHSGGPMCTSLSALVLEIGPLMVDVAAYNEDMPYLVHRPTTWTKTSNMIFVDAPIWTGFSYANVSNYMINDSKSAHQLAVFIKKWLISHPEFLTNPLYVGGDSYAGKITPMTTQFLADGNNAGNKALLNLKGYIVGNPSTDEVYDMSHVVYGHGMGLISDELYEEAKQKCNGNYAFPTNDACRKTLRTVTECIGLLNWVHILEPICERSFLNSPKAGNGARSMAEEVGEAVNKNSPLTLECRESAYHVVDRWANIEGVRDALNIRKGTVKESQRCTIARLFKYKSDISSSIIYHLNVTSRGYRALVYSGDHDLTTPHVGTQAWIRSLNFPIVDEWRPWFVDAQVAGYTKTYSNNLTFATVKGAGHAAPEYKPKECLAMLSRWLSESAV